MSRDITLWVDERWYDALSKHLGGETLEDHLQNVIDEMCRQLPQYEYEQISSLVLQEDQQRQQKQEAGRRFAVFHVTERCDSSHFLVEGRTEMLRAAFMLRNYIRGQGRNPSLRFADMFPGREVVSQEQFKAFAAERMENTGRVTGAYDIDMDAGTFTALNIMAGWQTFRIQDISTAAYYAMKNTHASSDERWTVFLDRLDGRQLTADSVLQGPTGRRILREEDIQFADDISEMDGKLNFYLLTCFDVDAAFGTHVCTTENDDWLNVYANYDMEAGQVCDELEVDLHQADGREESVEYRLNETEKALLLRKMEAYCLQQTGQTLKDYSAQLMEESMEPPTQPVM